MSNGKITPGLLHLRRGRTINLLDPSPEDIHLEDIVYALCNINRFNGHTRYPYSVAQHSLFVADLCSKDMQKEALLHDATEAYLGDVVAPLKSVDEMMNYRILETDMRWVIAEKFFLEMEPPPEVCKADKYAGGVEYQELVLNESPTLSHILPDYRIDTYNIMMARLRKEL